MATIPIVNTADKRAGIITSVITLGLLLLYLFLVTLEKADPPPADPILITETIMPPEIDLKNFVVEGAAGASATDDPVKEPTPQTQEVITTNKPSTHTSPTGASTNTNANNNTNTSSSAAASNSPFGGGGAGGENGTNFGHSTGPGNSGTGGGGGIDRVRLNKLNLDHLNFSEYATISLSLTLDSKGNVIAVTLVKAKTTTTNQIIINKVIAEVQRQLKYNEDPGSASTKVPLDVNITPN